MGRQIQPVAVHGPVVKSPWTALNSRPVWALGVLAALALIAEVVPALESVRVLSAAQNGPTQPAGVAPPVMKTGEATLEQETSDRPELAQPEHVEIPTGSRGPIAEAKRGPELKIDVAAPPVPIVDPSGRALDGFFRAMSDTLQKKPGAMTRVIHFGDSIVTSDYVSGTLRRKLQAQLGDAGHGYLLMANAWPAYFHNDVSRFASAGWSVSRIVGPLTPDGLYGLGGVTFRAPPGSRARFGTSKTTRYGTAVSRFVVSYLEQPGGGTMRLNLDSKHLEDVDTNGAAVAVREKIVRVPDGPHELEVVTVKGTTRAFGVVMERDTPGAVLDAIGIQGARIRFLDKQDDAHYAQQLSWRKPNLLIYQFGANESGDGFAYPMDEYQRTMRDVLQQGKKAVPEAGCLIIGAMDRAEKKGTTLSTMPVIIAIVKEQRIAAKATGCAFFDTFEAMGGSGSMAAWVQRGLGQADLTHPTGSGSEVLASWIFRALMQDYSAWTRTRPE
jgi:lysophospholipase L1-like esterase